jgi:hypothetical protein
MLVALTRIADCRERENRQFTEVIADLNAETATRRGQTPPPNQPQKLTDNV